MSIKLPSEELPRPMRLASDVISGTVTVAIRSAALVVFLALSMGEPVVAFFLCAMALGCFSVAVLFGFILHAYFPHRWFVLGASIVFLATYLLYRSAMLCVQRLMR
jgi:TRAP-type mannitol/chloroaromatic compound transport system permease large subunit